MYLTQLRIQNLKLLKDFELSFTDAEGRPRMWTVIIGENGTAKTSILQAIAMAAAGALNVNGLAQNVSSLRDKRDSKATVCIRADFLLDAKRQRSRVYPGYSGRKPKGGVVVHSEVELPPKRKDLVARSSYAGVDGTQDPITDARSMDAKLWFVAAYGVQRFLPGDPNARPVLDHASVERMRSVFQRVDLIGTGFANILKPEKARIYSRVLRDALFGKEGLLPGFNDLELRGQKGAGTTKTLQEGHRFVQNLPSGELKLAASWLSHGYQSTIAWLADLVGHILWEAQSKEALAPEDMEGLVLLDEIDLYLHPRWQRTIIRALKATFPRLQFVATTHSPLALVGLRPDQDEIVRLVIDDKTGDVRQLDMKQERAHEPDPRLMTGTEIYRTYFGIDQLYPDELGELLREHRYLAADPTRSAKADKRLDALEEKLREEGVEPDFPREPRRQR
ncbi:AAA family ATPase [Chondromyces apiculatus]|uniref:ATPase AAA-type core domain-containing protein n=1 Tax=Chondromyces apiculatus DSM 436 TaxID=1192034 RepID=A0A017T4N9_9BACT|nr:AAA family ATPase [Chondromyces apiculatus]EYF04189.1 Hypothetical protein CAP_4666 [Chondromyces apiculatus DSM 436]